jgi:hypothetical protein
MSRKLLSTRFELRLPPVLRRRIDAWVTREQERRPEYNASDLVREALWAYFDAKAAASVARPNG